MKSSTNCLLTALRRYHDMPETGIAGWEDFFQHVVRCAKEDGIEIPAGSHAEVRAVIGMMSPSKRASLRCLLRLGQVLMMIYRGEPLPSGSGKVTVKLADGNWLLTDESGTQVELPKPPIRYIRSFGNRTPRSHSVRTLVRSIPS